MNRYLTSLIIGMLFIGFGAVTLLFDISEFEIIEDANHLEYITNDYEYTLPTTDNKKVDIDARWGEVDVYYDYEHEDKILVKATYPEIAKDHISNWNTINNNELNIIFRLHAVDIVRDKWDNVFNMFFEDLKKKRIYNYGEELKFKLEVHAPQELVNKINFSGGKVTIH